MVLHWSLSDNKSPQVSRTRVRNLAVLSNAVVWIVFFFFFFFFFLLLLLLLLFLESFLHQFLLMVFYWSLSDIKSPRVFRTLISILADYNNSEVLMVCNCPFISKPSSPFINPLLTVIREPIIIGINVTFGNARGVMVIVAGIGHSNTSSNPGLIAFHIALILLGKVWIQLFSLQLWVNSRAD